MKKTLIALAAVAVSTGAMAQAHNQATISGTFNVDMQNNAGVDANTTDRGATFAMGDAIVRVGVTEDLGGGLSIAANTTLNSKAGRGQAVTGNGFSFAMSGGFGTVSLINYLAGGASLNAGISAAQDMNTAVATYQERTRLNYALPTLVPGLTAQLRVDSDHGSKGTIVNPSFDNTAKFAVAYKTGAFNIGADGNLDNIAGSTIYLGYDAGFAKIDYARRDSGHYEITAVAPLTSQVSAGLHYIDGGVTEAMGFRVTYALSKRTAVSFNYVDITVPGASDTSLAGNNYRVRVSHSF